MEESLKKKKVLDYKTYNSIPHISGGRLDINDTLADASIERKFTKELDPHVKTFIYIEEKMDGSNVCVVRHHGRLIPVGRSGFPCEDSNQDQHRMFYQWVMKYQDKFEKLLPNDGDRVVGEWMMLAHGTIYTKEFLNVPFMAFDIFQNKNQQLNMYHRRKLIEEVGLVNVPLLLQTDQPVDQQYALSLLKNPDAEGVVYRIEKVEGSKEYKAHATYKDGKPWFIGKVIKKDKVDGKYLKDVPEFTWNFTQKDLGL